VRVIAVDPGETIGLAYYDSDTGVVRVTQTNTPELAYGDFAVWVKLYRPDELIVENYHSSGHLSREGKTTIEVLGLFKYGAGCSVVAPQARLAFVSQAEELLKEERKDMHRKGRDAISALAHAIAYVHGAGE